VADAVFFPDFFRVGAHHQALLHDGVDDLLLLFFFSNRRPFSRRKRARNNSHVRGESFIFSEPFNVKSVALLCVCASVLFFCFQKALCEDTEAKEHNTEAESM